MELIFALYFIFAVLYWFLRFIDWVIRTIGTAVGVIKPPYKPYSFEQDVLKPLGYTYVDYFVNPGITFILRVKERLSDEFLKRISKPDWHFVQDDIDRNKRMEEEFIENLKKPIC
jgi:hypothetical protein